MMLKIQCCITGINYILKYIKIDTVILNSNNISQYYSQINAALVKEKSYWPQTFERKVD